VRIDVVGLGQGQFLGHFADRLVGQLRVGVGEHFLENLAPKIGMFLAPRLAQEAADFGARAPGHHELFP
jgi:hypothetical protein